MKKALLIILISGLCSLMAQGQNVGVTNATGGITPMSLLHVHSTLTSGQLFQLSNANTAGGNTPTANSGFNIGFPASATNPLTLKDVIFNQYEFANMLFYTNNTARMTINPSGNVGIGTTSPTNARLQIEGSSTYDAVLRLNSTGSNGASVFFVASMDGWTFGANKLGIGFGIPSSANVKMTILPGGNVGIGSTSPSAQLHTTGTVRFAGYPSGPNGAIVRTDASGNLAITNFTGNATNILLGDNTFGTIANAGGVTSACGTANYVPKMASATAMSCSQIYDDGTNVGIGTTSPSKKLHLYQTGALAEMVLQSNGHDNAYAGGKITFNNDDFGGFGNITYVNDAYASNYMSMGVNYFQNAITINGDGPFASRNSNLAVGTTLYVNDVVNGTVVNKVGIGTSSPAAKLDINGDLKINSQSSTQKRHISTITRSIGASAGDYVYLGTITSNGAGTYASIRQSHHFCGTINAAAYEITDVYYSGTTTDWMQVPTQNYRSYNGSQDFSIDVRRTANHPTTLEIRVRNISGTCGAGSIEFEVQTNGTFTASTTSGSGASVAGFLSNNAYQFPVSNNLFKASTDGIFILNTGNVGIGTTSPTAQLHTTGTVRLQNYISGTLQVDANGYLSVGSGSNVFAAGTGLSWSGNTLNSLWTANGNNIYNNNSGNVGIGTTSPANKLHVSSGDASLALFGPNTSWGGKLFVGAAPNQASASTAQVISTDGNLHLDPAPSKNMYLGFYQPRDIYINPNGGNVGIGTTSPATKLHVVGNIRMVDGNQALGKVMVSDANGTGSWQKLNINTYTIPNTSSSSQWVKLGRLTIAQDGQSAFIKVVSNTGYNATIEQNYEVYIRFKTSNASSVNANGFAGDGSYYVTGRNSQFFTNDRIKFVGNTAGTSATAYDVYMYFGNYTGAASFYEISTTGGTWVHAGATGQSDPGAASATVMIPTQEFNVAANSLVVNSAGQVGIGTNTPDDKLDVVGNAQVSGYLKVGNPSAPSSVESNTPVALYSWNNQSGIYGLLSGTGCGSTDWDFLIDGLSSYYRYDNNGSRAFKPLMTPWVWVPTTSTGVMIELNFYNSLESTYDGVFVEYTTDGSTWTLVNSWQYGGYNTSIVGSNSSCNANINTSGWSDTGDEGPWSNNLALNGRWVRFRLVAIEDGSNSTGIFELYGLTIWAENAGSLGGSFADGNIYAQKNVYAGSNVLMGDVAEYFNVKGISLPGQLISLNPNEKDAYVVSSKKNDPNVIGIYSTAPTLTINSPNSGIPVALSGRVPVCVSNENGKISPGDYLTASSRPGYACKATEACYVIGQALENFDDREGKIICLLKQNWYMPYASSNTGSGNFFISKGKDKITIIDKKISEDSKVFLTMLGDPQQRYWISEKANGSFTISFSGEVFQDVNFDYFIDNANKEPVEESNKITSKDEYVSVHKPLDFDRGGWQFDKKKNIYWRPEPEKKYTSKKEVEMISDEEPAPPKPDDENSGYIFYKNELIKTLDRKIGK